MCPHAAATRLRRRLRGRARARGPRPHGRVPRDARDARRMARVRLAIVGCGNIAARYAASIAAAPGLELAGATDVVPGRADEFVAEHGGVGYSSLGALLAADDVDAVVN